MDIVLCVPENVTPAKIEMYFFHKEVKHHYGRYFVVVISIISLQERPTRIFVFDFDGYFSQFRNIFYGN